MIKRIFLKIFGANRKKNSTKFQELLANGNLIVGSNCNLNGLSIEMYGTEPGYVNIIIGKDSYLMGNIVLYSNKAKVVIGDRVFIGPNTTLFCYDGVQIENDVMISWGCTLITTNAHSLKSKERENDVVNWMKGWQYKDWSVVESKSILVKKKSWIGFNSIITKGVIIEEGTVVASGSVVTKNTEPYTVVGGNPAAFIKKTE